MQEVNAWNREHASKQLRVDVRVAVAATEGGPPKAAAPRIWGVIGIVPLLVAATFNALRHRTVTAERFIAVTDDDVIILDGLPYQRRTCPGPELQRAARTAVALRSAPNGMLVLNADDREFWSAARLLSFFGTR